MTFDAMPPDIDHLEKLRPLLDAGSLDGAVVQGLDLRPFAERLAEVSVDGTVFLDCHLPAGLRGGLPDRGAVVFPRLDGFPFRPYRSHLYTPEELFAGYDPNDPCSYCQTLDARIYDYWRDTGRGTPGHVLDALARRLHDQSITGELHALLATRADSARDVVAVMGGHSLSRHDPAYREVATLAHRLARAGYLMVSGGGPGAMEATNLGAWLAPLDDSALDEAVATLAEAPTYRHPRWLTQAFRVKARFAARLAAACDAGAAETGDAPPTGGVSLGIPTWLYGHEPPNPFATHIAKYFANSVREEGLITIARGGIVYAPGAAGTIQEIFQDAAQNRYAVTGEVSPMVFLDRAFWGREKPVYPLLTQLAEGQQYADFLTLVDTADEAIAFLRANPPQPTDTAAWTYCDDLCGDGAQA